MLDIPNLDLGRMSCSPSAMSSALDDSSAPSSRRTSLSSTGRPGGSVSGRSGSGTSSRSTSFSLPEGAKGKISKDGKDLGEEVETDEEEMDAEGMLLFTLTTPVVERDLTSCCETRGLSPASGYAL